MKTFSIDKLGPDEIPFINDKIGSSVKLQELHMIYKIDKRDSNVLIVFDYHEPIDKNYRKTINVFFRTISSKLNLTLVS